MSRIRLLATALLLFTALPAWGQTVYRVETVAAQTGITDALAIGPDGDIYGSDFRGSRVYRVNPDDGSAHRHSQAHQNPNGLAFGPDGTLYVAEYTGQGIFQVNASRRRSRLVGANTTVSGLLYDHPEGILYVTSYDSNWIKRIKPGRTTTLFSIATEGLNGPAGLALDSQGRLHVANFNDGKIHRVEDNGDLTLLADVPGGIGFLAHGGGQFFATGIDTHRIYAISESGEVTTIAGNGQSVTQDGVGGDARFNGPNGIVASAAGDTLYVSEFGSSSLRRLIRTDASRVDVEDVPVRTGHLHTPFPNPAEQSTTVQFDLAEAGPAAVTVYDLLGREVEQLTTGPLAAGTHVVELTTADWVPGSYLVRLEAGEYAATTPLVVVR
ncbi:MAG: SMP-30/gluconolactonase/LRE family protein [Bacteroidota bacterium]